MRLIIVNTNAALIQQEATFIRRALEQIVHTLEGLQSFPRGACGNASALLGEWLIRKGFKDVEYVSGSSGEIKSHAWLECDGLIIDITADQFGAGMRPVFVGRVRRVGVHGSTGSPRTGCSNFHDRFEIQSRHPCVMDGAFDQVNYEALEMYLLQPSDSGQHRNGFEQRPVWVADSTGRCNTLECA